jgi:uncharacterized protein YecE (DUF72 family)
MDLNHKQQIRVGCSGWQYRHWRGDLYPAELPTSRWFAHYSQTFDTVEINNSFYRLPEAETFAKWRDQAPSGFLYAVKASRFLTHMKKLKDPDEPLTRFFGRAQHLRSTLGPVLYQLPPRWPVDLPRFAAFLSALPRQYSHAVEFREPSWYDDRVFALLEEHRVALCLHDMQGSATERLAIGPFVYVRFHFGTTRYGGRYDDRRLDDWAEWLAERIRRGLSVFTYFNNDVGGHAPRDAVRLRTRLKALLNMSHDHAPAANAGSGRIAQGVRSARR